MLACFSAASRASSNCLIPLSSSALPDISIALPAARSILPASRVAYVFFSSRRVASICFTRKFTLVSSLSITAISPLSNVESAASITAWSMFIAASCSLIALICSFIIADTPASVSSSLTAPLTTRPFTSILIPSICGCMPAAISGGVSSGRVNASRSFKAVFSSKPGIAINCRPIMVLSTIGSVLFSIFRPSRACCAPSSSFFWASRLVFSLLSDCA